MIIGIDASRANKPHKTGTEWYAYHLIRWFAKIDSTNEYILYSNTPLTDGLQNLELDNKNTLEKLPDEIKYDEKDFQLLKSPHNNFKGKILKWPLDFFWTQGRLALEMIWRRPNILFVPSHTLPIFHPKKSIITIHDVGFARDRKMYDKDIMGPNRKWQNAIVNFFVKIFTFGKYGANNLDYLMWSTIFGLKHAKKVITVSNYSKEEIMDMFDGNEKKISVIHNGYKNDHYVKIENQSEIDAVLKKYQINRPYILYVGRLEKKKNTPALIEAFSMFKQMKENQEYNLLLVGNASYGYDEVNYAIHEFGLEQDVVMPGWIAEADMPYIFNGAAAFVFPSKYEGFGIPLLQAMGCGVPVAASWSSSIPEVTGNAALLFNPNNVKEIADAINKVINNQELRDELLLRGKERIKDFSWEKCARETLKEILEK